MATRSAAGRAGNLGHHAMAPPCPMARAVAGGLRRVGRCDAGGRAAHSRSGLVCNWTSHAGQPSLVSLLLIESDGACWMRRPCGRRVPTDSRRTNCVSVDCPPWATYCPYFHRVGWRASFSEESFRSAAGVSRELQKKFRSAAGVSRELQKKFAPPQASPVSSKKKFRSAAGGSRELQRKLGGIASVNAEPEPILGKASRRKASPLFNQGL